MNARNAPEDTALTREQRATALEGMSGTEGLDVLVVGGGITGAGIALDAAGRGLRYLYQLDFPLVHEALTERGRLLETTAPHLVKAQPFLWPLKRAYERSYSAVGVGMYDALAVAGARGRRGRGRARR